jgi:hypothetical protein
MVRRGRNGAARAQVQRLQQPRHLPRDDAAAAVVVRALPHVPRVEVAADEDDLVRLLSAFKLRDDVGRLGVGQEARLHPEAQAGALAAVVHALQHLRALDGDGGRGNLRAVLRVAERARVRRLKADGRDGADDGGDRAVLRRARGARAAVADRLAVGGEGRVVDDYLAAHLRAESFKLVEVADDDGLGRNPPGRRADAVAEAQHREPAARGLQKLKALLAPDPVGHHHLLGAHVVQPVAPHLRDRPGDGALQVLGPAQAVADAVGEPREPPVGHVARERRADDARRALAVLFDLHARRRQGLRRRDDLALGGRRRLWGRLLRGRLDDDERGDENQRDGASQGLGCSSGLWRLTLSKG